jgi:hypothetical protein
MQVSSASYIVFDTATNASVIDIDTSNQLPGTTGTVPYSFSSEQIQLTTTFSSTETARKGMCLKPPVVMAGVQAFVAFTIPSSLQTGTAVEVWLTSADGKSQVSSAIKATSSGQLYELVGGTEKDTQTLLLETNKQYVLLVSVDESCSFVVSQVITVKNDPIVTASVYLTDDALISALQTNTFSLCVALSSNTNSRAARQSKSASVNVHYYGSQRIGTVGKIPAKQSGITSGAIAGAVIGSLLGCLLLVSVSVVVVIVIVTIRQKKVPVPKNKRQHAEEVREEHQLQEIVLVPPESVAAPQQVLLEIPKESSSNALLNEQVASEVESPVKEDQVLLTEQTSHEPENINQESVSNDTAK